MSYSGQHQQCFKGVWVSDRLCRLIASKTISCFDAIVFGYFHSFQDHSCIFSEACRELPFRQQRLASSLRKLEQLGMVESIGASRDRIIRAVRESPTA